MSFDPVEDKITPKPLRIIGKIIKIVLALSLIVMLGWLLLRSCYQSGTKKMKSYMWTEKAAEAYEGGELTVKKLQEFNNPKYQGPNGPKTNSLFFIGNLFYTKEINQFQFMIRYNVLNADYKEMADDNGNVDLRFELTDKAGTHYTDYYYITDSALMYRYYRIAFEDVDVELADELYVDIILITDDDEIKVGSCKVWDKEAPDDDYKLKSDEKKASKPTKGLVSYKMEITE